MLCCAVGVELTDCAGSGSNLVSYHSSVSSDVNLKASYGYWEPLQQLVRISSFAILFIGQQVEMSGVAAVWVIIATVSGASLTCASAVETTRLQSTALSAHTVTVSASSLSREQFQQMYDGKQQPLVLRDVLALNRSQWVDALLDTLYQTKVEYDARSIVPPVSYTGRIDASGSPELAENYENSFASEPLTYDLIYGSIAADAVSDTVPEVETYEADFVDFVDSLYDNSDHYDNIYLMSEFLLKEKVESTGKALENDFILNEKLFEKNLFDYFPASIRPRAALIVGGVGARSFLHADPYEWTGWNYLLEGRKLCKNLLSPLSECC